MTKPVGTDQRDHGHSPLCQPTGVLDCGRRGIDALRDHPVLDHVQDSRNVLLHAGCEQVDDQIVAVKFRNVLDQLLPHVAGHLGQLADHCRRNLRGRGLHS